MTITTKPMTIRTSNSWHTKGTLLDVWASPRFSRSVLTMALWSGNDYHADFREQKVRKGWVTGPRSPSGRGPRGCGPAAARTPLTMALPPRIPGPQFPLRVMQTVGFNSRIPPGSKADNTMWNQKSKILLNFPPKNTIQNYAPRKLNNSVSYKAALILM